MAGKSDAKSGRGVPRKAGNKQRGVRRARNLSKQLERKLRHILRRNTRREADKYAEDHFGGLAILKKLIAEYGL